MAYRLRKKAPDILEDDQKFCFLQINKDRLNPFKCSEMILNYKGKMLDEVNRTEGDLQTTEDDLQTTEDDRGMTEDDQNVHLQTNKASLNPFECSEMMGTIKGGRKMIEEVNWTEGHLL